METVLSKKLLLGLKVTKYYIYFLDGRYEYANKNRGNARLVFMSKLYLVKLGLHIVVTIAQHVCDRAFSISTVNISCEM